jgi:glycosyltransferase involved in cell wall biosynthesis
MSELRKRILVVAMFDSIHTARWLSQFNEEEVEFLLFPSKPYRKLHVQIYQLLLKEKFATYSLFGGRAGTLLPYLYFAINKIAGHKALILTQSFLLQRCIRKFKPNFLHAMELQGAGYITASLTKETRNYKLICSTWGSDIVFFKDNQKHRELIIKTLKGADFYSAECERDYKMALDLGFQGKKLPIIPVAGSYNREILYSQQSLTSSRNQIIVKSYGGTFGLGGTSIEVLNKILSENSDLIALFYSVTEDLYGQIRDIKIRFGDRVRWIPAKEPLQHHELLQEFRKSKIYLGVSRCDGISTSFLESLCMGAFPVQTNTSCANEWIEKGAIGILPNPSADEIYKAIDSCIHDDELLNFAQANNIEIAKKFLSREEIYPLAREFYSL